MRIRHICSCQPAKTLRVLALTAVVPILGTLTPHATYAAAGDLHRIFGRGGTAITDFNRTDDYGFAVKVQSDGKIVVAGETGVYPLFHSGLTRYNANGRLDGTFGAG